MYQPSANLLLESQLYYHTMIYLLCNKKHKHNNWLDLQDIMSSKTNKQNNDV